MAVPIDKLTENDRTCKKSEESCCKNPNTSGGRAGFGDGGFSISFHGKKPDAHLGAVEDDIWDGITDRDHFGFPIPGTRWKNQY